MQLDIRTFEQKKSDNSASTETKETKCKWTIGQKE